MYFFFLISFPFLPEEFTYSFELSKPGYFETKIKDKLPNLNKKKRKTNFLNKIIKGKKLQSKKQFYSNLCQ